MQDRTKTQVGVLPVDLRSLRTVLVVVHPDYGAF